jgi:hypothetical protein
MDFESRQPLEYKRKSHRPMESCRQRPLG